MTWSEARFWEGGGRGIILVLNCQMRKKSSRGGPNPPKNKEKANRGRGGPTTQFYARTYGVAGQQGREAANKPVTLARLDNGSCEGASSLRVNRVKHLIRAHQGGGGGGGGSN